MTGRLLAVALGGSFGAVARYLLSTWVGRLGPSLAFPFGTLVVNVLGSFCLGLLTGASLAASQALGENTKALLGIGFLGSFTTFSTFSVETLRAFEAGAPGLALLNVATNVLLCLMACGLGLWIAGRI